MTDHRIPTAVSLIEQLSENTGRHMLDSGGAYGRGFERWGTRLKGLDITAAATEILAGPTAYVQEGEYISVVAIPNLASQLTYLPVADRVFQRWVELDDAATSGQKPWLVSAERYVSRLLAGNPDVDVESIPSGSYGGEGVRVSYSYNWEHMLTEQIQWVEFTAEESTAGLVAGERYVLLQTHNGCDARGGFSRPRVYALAEDAYLTDASVYAQHSITHPQDEVLDLDVPEREGYHAFDLRAGEWTSMDGDYLFEKDDQPTYAVDNDGQWHLVCPTCGERMEVGSEM